MSINQNHEFQSEIMILENDQVKAEFNSWNGALVSLVYKSTGWIFQSHPELGQSFRLVVPLPERLLNIVDGQKQQAASVAIDEGGECLTFTWTGLQSEFGGWLDINLVGSVSLTETGLTFQMQIDNQSRYPVESCAYPYLGELDKPVSSGNLIRASYSYDQLVCRPLFPQFPNERGYWGTEYPIQMVSTPDTLFVLILTKNQGLYVGCHDTSAEERVEFTFRLIPGYGKVGFVPEEEQIAERLVRIEFYAEHLTFVQPGESRKLSPIVFNPFQGDWHAGADVYRVWRNKWMKKPEVPEWMADIHAWQQLQMTSWGDTLNLRYNELPAYTEVCVEKGVKAIQLVGWTLYGQDGRLPIHDIDPRLGSREDLKSAIHMMQEQGLKVILYEKYTCVDKGTNWYKQSLYRLTSKDIFGNTHGHEGWRYDTPAHLAGINTRPYAWMCMNSVEWQDIALAEIEKSLELNPDGILLDEAMWHGTNAFYCFDRSHGHRIPAYNFSGDEEFEKRLRELVDEKIPGAILAGEGPYDLQNRHYDLSYHRAGDGHIPAIRYIDPFLPMMSWVYGFDDREGVNLCLLYRYIISYEPRNFRGKLDEFSMTLEYGNKVDALRSRYREYLWDAEFRDTIGARLLVEDQEYTLYTVFKQLDTNRCAVVIANHDLKNEIIVDIRIDNFTECLYMVTPEEPNPQKNNGKVRIKPRSVVVVFES